MEKSQSNLNTPHFEIDDQKTFFLKSELERYKQQVEQLQSQYYYQKSEKLKRVNEELEMKISQLYEELKANEEYEEELSKDRLSLMNEKNKLEAKLQNQQDLFIHESLQYKQVLKQHEQLTNQRTELISETKYLKNELEQAKSKVSALESELHKEIGENNLIKDELTTKEKQLERLNGEFDLVNHHYHIMKTQLDESQENNQKLLTEILNRTTAFEQIFEQIKEINERFEQTNKQLAEAESSRKKWFFKTSESYKKQLSQDKEFYAERIMDIQSAMNEQKETLEKMKKTLGTEKLANKKISISFNKDEPTQKLTPPKERKITNFSIDQVAKRSQKRFKVKSYHGQVHRRSQKYK
ncbi:hypothetical protein [Metabacillus arenae]|uniref:Uncharacterized protein n=1 Tax=Metabacillus arenae TaxID=2771434 RepID=A0A926NHT3_9BACI|nr:hypothetical protein [Metabacillus arenae]MBD1381310.1 hypothetical protein [Metabacillus arenae]